MNNSSESNSYGNDDVDPKDCPRAIRAYRICYSVMNGKPCQLTDEEIVKRFRKDRTETPSHPYVPRGERVVISG